MVLSSMKFEEFEYQKDNARMQGNPLNSIDLSSLRSEPIERSKE